MHGKHKKKLDLQLEDLTNSTGIWLNEAWFTKVHEYARTHRCIFACWTTRRGPDHLPRFTVTLRITKKNDLKALVLVTTGLL